MLTVTFAILLVVLILITSSQFVVHIGRCYTLITKDGERTFAINEGQMNQLSPDSIPECAFKQASALVLSSYLVRGKPTIQ